MDSVDIGSTHAGDDFSYLTAANGDRAGANFVLNATDINRLGRGVDCDVVLADPLCSRVHAEIFLAADGWRLRDRESRNGSFVNDQKVDETVLVADDRIRLGSSEFTFHRSDQPPTLAGPRGEGQPESIVREAPVDSDDSGRLALAALRRTDNAHEIVVLYELAVKLLGCEHPNEVLRITLELIHERTGAELVGFLWVTEEGQLKPQMCVPQVPGKRVTLSQSLTQVVLVQRRAVWVANQASVATADSLKAYADALCVPVLSDRNIVGALHLYLGDGNFRDIDFDFAISVAQLLGVALARSHRQARLEADHNRVVASNAAFDEILGDSTVMEELKLKIQRLASASGAVLISGESGSGKELVARAVHKSSARAERPLLAVNCAAIPANLVESQLFGHVKGAFTGATDDHRGWFEQADTGTLFLDEVGELPLEAQAKLLRILEGHPFQPVGGSREIRTDVRILAATNRRLKKAVDAKQFREDLYYRLSVFELRVPPLRDREADLELLINHFLDHFKKRHGRPATRLSDEARAKLTNYPWPGNVRQLRNVIDSAVVLAQGDEIRPEDLGLHDAGTDHLETLRIDDWERKLIREALNRKKGNVPEAAKLLGIGLRHLVPQNRRLQDPAVMWQFSIDVGGTFTDCVAIDPRGNHHRAKLLSSGEVPGTIEQGSTHDCLVDPCRQRDPPDFWVNYWIRLDTPTGATLSTNRVRAFDHLRGRLQLADPLAAEPVVGTRYAIVSDEEAPVLAMRLLTRTGRHEALPPLRVRLGTTKGTNALLTRSGANTAFLTTAGFADLLEIGNQDRPHLFELAISKPAPCYSTVIEIAERVAADGMVLQAPDPQTIRRQLTQLKRDGIDSLAICLLHAHAYPAHEQLVGTLAREIGFRNVSLSHHVSPHIKAVPRASTTVADAYLSPVIRDYVARIEEVLPKTGDAPLRLLTSAGGLVRASAFDGKDSILSGPAGGVVGFSRAAEAAGFERAIGLDMGGTSCDVSRYHERPAIKYETETHGIHLQAPMLDIKTVAAGGGSICRFDGVKLVVGPESAGADPGPACYGRGGPLCVTDMNVVLGRLIPDRFPFALHVAAAASRLAELAALVSKRTGQQLTSPELALGFLRIANTNMAHAVRSVSVDQGVRSARLCTRRFRWSRSAACLRGGSRVGNRPNPDSSRRRPAQRGWRRTRRRRPPSLAGYLPCLER